MKQLGILDAAFINLEQTNTPQHVGGLGIYDPSTAPGGFVRFKDVIAGFERRLGKLPLFRTRIVEVPRRQLGFAQRQDVSRTALSPTSTPRVASRPTGTTVAIPPAALGGLRQMDGDHPRYGMQPSVSGGRY